MEKQSPQRGWKGPPPPRPPPPECSPGGPHLYFGAHILLRLGPDRRPRVAVGAGVPLALASNREEFRALAPLVVATLRALNTFSDDAFRVHLSVRRPPFL